MNATIEAPRILQGKPAIRRIDYHLRFDFEINAPILTIDCCEYLLSEFPADGGRAFDLHKIGTEERYSVFVGLTEYPICCCRGFERFGRCKHVHVLTDAVRTGLLSGRWDLAPEAYPSSEQLRDEENIPF